MNTIRFIFITTLFTTPYITYADIEISEIMYDYEGTDTGNEWVELHNTGSSPINLEDWSFRENEVNHGLQFQGSSTIEPDAYMVIVQNVEQFQLLHGNSVNIIKSSFSLNNTGEILEIVNGSDEVVDSHRYSNETGAQGDGKSLQKVGTVWGTGIPTPGTHNEHSSGSNTDDEPDTVEDNEPDGDVQETPTTTSDPIIEEDTRKKQRFKNYYEPYISFPKTVVAHSPTRFQVGVFYIQESSKTRKKNGLYYLNFGDGTLLESDERIDTIHRYPSPGSYIVSFEYYTSSLQREYGEAELVYQKKIEVADTSIEIIGTDSNGGVILENTGNKNIDISEWMIRSNHSSYTFPRYSIINAQSRIAVSYTTLGFWVDEIILKKLFLENDNKLLIHRYQETPSEEQVVVTNAVTVSVDDIEIGENTINLDDTDHIEKHTYEYQSDEPQQKSFPYQLIVIILGALVISISVTRYVKRKQPM